MNERRTEIDALCKFVSRRKPFINSLLDVGCSHSIYHHMIRGILGDIQYDGIDLWGDYRVISTLDRFYLADFFSHEFPEKYDAVVCVSVLEHIGIKQEPFEPMLRMELVKMLYNLATNHLFLTFPYGAAGGVANEYVNVTTRTLDSYLRIMNGFRQISFYYNANPTNSLPWAQVDDEFASNVRAIPGLGIQCICVLEVDKLATIPVSLLQ